MLTDFQVPSLVHSIVLTYFLDHPVHDRMQMEYEQKLKTASSLAMDEAMYGTCTLTAGFL